jgi:polyhydroxyalkanoate synthesis regulator protein
MTQPPNPRSPAAPHVVKRYAGARLYDTSTLSYVTVDQLRAMVRTDAQVAIYDADDGHEITRSILGLN